MPKSSRKHFALSEAYVEEIHDVLVSRTWPGDEPVSPGEFRDARLLDSATARPFQTAFGQELHKSIFQKAAALFHALIANHPFTNGNKRTAVVALDHFLLANGYFLAMSEDEMYGLAKTTASYREQALSHEGMLAQIIERLRDKSHSDSDPLERNDSCVVQDSGKCSPKHPQ